MRVIFTDDVDNVARTGDVKEVKTGYARNYLIPKGLAVAATPQQLIRLDALQKIGMERSTRELEEAQDLAIKLDGANVAIKVKAGPRGRLFGSVTNAMIAKEVSDSLGITVDRKGIILGRAIHELGSFDIKVRVHPEVAANISLMVESDSDVAIEDQIVDSDVTDLNTEATLVVDDNESEEQGKEAESVEDDYSVTEA
jgi:large subunit ribosomal protein L9